MKWFEIRRGSKVTLNKKYTYKGLDKIKKELPQGTYYINGFWGDGCGLSRSLDELNEFVIPSKGLVYFEEVEDE